MGWQPIYPNSHCTLDKWAASRFIPPVPSEVQDLGNKASNPQFCLIKEETSLLQRFTDHASYGEPFEKSTLAGYFQANLVSKFRGCHKQIHDAARDRSHRDHCDVIHTYKRDEHGEEVLKTPRNIPITLGLGRSTSRPRVMTGRKNNVRDRLMYNADMSTISQALAELETERTTLTSQIEALRNAISALNGSGPNRTAGPRELSAAARAKIAAAQRARWARAKKSKVISISAGKKKRKMSASAIARIRAAQKARWAKWRKSNRKSA